MIKKELLLEGDCLELMYQIPDKSVDLILADLPYQNSKLSWDVIIPFKPLWDHYERVIKDNGTIILTSKQPFTSKLVMSNLKLFRYELIWLKTRPSNFMNAKKMYMNWHENILVFYKSLPTFNRQMEDCDIHQVKIKKQDRSNSVFIKTGEKEDYEFNNDGKKNPKSVLEFSNPNTASSHPTQKPVLLMEYLIKTYSNEGDLVLDNVAGSGSTGVAARNTNRNFILIEKEQKYCEIIKQRLKL